MHRVPTAHCHPDRHADHRPTAITDQLAAEMPLFAVVAHPPAGVRCCRSGRDRLRELQETRCRVPTRSVGADRQFWRGPATVTFRPARSRPGAECRVWAHRRRPRPPRSGRELSGLSRQIAPRCGIRRIAPRCGGGDRTTIRSAQSPRRFATTVSAECPLCMRHVESTGDVRCWRSVRVFLLVTWIPIGRFRLSLRGGRRGGR